MTTAFHTDARYAEHTLEGHPEYAERLIAITDRLQVLGLSERLLHIEGREATEEELLRVHQPEYLRLLARLEQFDQPVLIGADTYALPISPLIARLAAGGVMNTVKIVIEGNASNGLAAVRPPGHHATPRNVMGFCLLNNIAIAARYVQREYQLEKIAIVDFDVHHGNGTQDTFYDDPTILFISSHQSPLYPGTGHIHEIGQGKGRGMTMNVPVPPGTGDVGIKMLYEQIVLPSLARFQPQLMLISAGFDGHWRDPLANLNLSLAMFAGLVHLLIEAANNLCDGKIIFVTEGGYDLEVLSYGVANTIGGLLGDSTVHDPIGKAMAKEKSVEALAEQLREIHQI